MILFMATRRRIGLLAGAAIFLILLIVPAPSGLEVPAWRTAALALLMATWWMTEAIPIPATSLLPVVLLPLLEVRTIEEATAAYANPLIFLFLGGFILAIGMQVWNLHRRLALGVLRRIGTNPRAIVWGVMLSAAILSMWVSNTSTALVMLPIALSLIETFGTSASEGGASQSPAHFATALMLCIAYGCNIGGMGTLIGTPPNAFLAAFMLENYGLEIGFAQWMLIGVPLVAVALPITFWLLTRVLYPVSADAIVGGRAIIGKRLGEMGSMKTPERRIAYVFALVAVGWMTRPLLAGFVPGLSDAGIAMIGAIALFLIPSGEERGGFLLRWEATRDVPWGMLILFGGGLSLASAINATGLAHWIGLSLGAASAWPILLLLVLVVTAVIFLTEITSNTATAAAFLPVLASAAIGIGENPLLLTVPAVLAASSAFMLPVATPPNAIVFGTSHVSIPQMSRAGLWLNLLFIALITLVGYLLLGAIFGVQFGQLPDWAL